MLSTGRFHQHSRFVRRLLPLFTSQFLFQSLSCFYLSPVNVAQGSYPKNQPSKLVTHRAMSVDPDAVGQADIGASVTGTRCAADESVKATEGCEKSWRSLMEVSSNRSRKIRGSNYVQLSTVDTETLLPRNRCVVLRGFLCLPEDHPMTSTCDGMSTIIKMITDKRSKKVDEVMKHPKRAAELVWWFPKSSEQYRVQGEIIFVGAGDFPYDDDVELKIARKQMWGNISDAARDGFLGQYTPGQKYDGESYIASTGGRNEEGKVVPPPDNFLLMLLKPNQVDFLRLTNMYRQEDVIVDGKWKSQRLNP